MRASFCSFIFVNKFLSKRIRQCSIVLLVQILSFVHTSPILRMISSSSRKWKVSTRGRRVPQIVIEPKLFHPRNFVDFNLLIASLPLFFTPFPFIRILKRRRGIAKKSALFLFTGDTRRCFFFLSSSSGWKGMLVSPPRIDASPSQFERPTARYNTLLDFNLLIAVTRAFSPPPFVLSFSPHPFSSPRRSFLETRDFVFLIQSNSIRPGKRTGMGGFNWLGRIRGDETFFKVLEYEGSSFVDICEFRESDRAVTERRYFWV